MTQPPIDRLFAWIMTDAEGAESLPAFVTILGPMPMVGMDRARLETLQGVAQSMCATTGGTMRLVEFGASQTLLAVSGEGGSRPH